MRLVFTHYGFCAYWDSRLQFHRVGAWISSHRRGGSGWEVWLNGRGGNPFFARLRDAKDWARPHWRPQFFPRLEACDLTCQSLIRAAIMSDELAFLAWFDHEEEDHGYYRDRKWYARLAREACLFRT
jgi:hypothetical protein